MSVFTTLAALPATVTAATKLRPLQQHVRRRAIIAASDTVAMVTGILRRRNILRGRKDEHAALH